VERIVPLTRIAEAVLDALRKEPAP
jgi:hypothetical protein